MTSDSRKSIHLQMKNKSTHPVSPLDAKSAKRRRVYPTKHQLPTPTSSISSSSSHEEVDPESSSKPTEIWGWTLSHDAIAPCFVKDVFDLRPNEAKDMEFWWLGRIPCRTVLLVGLIVGVQVYEKRTMYSVDDGTAVIDCYYRHPVRPRSPSKPTSTKSSSLNKYSLPPLTVVIPPAPVATVGTQVRITGKVVKTFERQIAIDEIVPCRSPNEEPLHWLAVLDLHKTKYFAKDLGPFVVPANFNPSSVHHDVKGDTTASSIESQEQPTRMQIPSPAKTASSVATPSTASSARSQSNDKSTRLPHPSRVHTDQLTANTFRMYLKYYMDHAPSPSPAYRPSSPTPFSRRHAEVLTSSDLNILAQPGTPGASKGKSTAPSTITNRRTASDADRTPRAPRSQKSQSQEQADAERTPSARQRAPASGISTSLMTGSDVDETGTGDSETLGFTLSYLRRVPELALLAQRVVKVAAKRRALEESKRAQSQPKPKPSVRTSSEPESRKVKRLFQFAIRQLFEEGAIVLWEGPVRPASAAISLDTLTLWKVSSSQDTMSMSMEQGFEAELSDPEDDEESYLPLRPKSFLPIIENTIRTLVARANAQARMVRAQTRMSTAERTLALHQRLSLQAEGPAPPPGPTPEEILAWLRRDERWARVGDWAVKEALEFGRKEGRVWCVGGGRWEGCW